MQRINFSKSKGMWNIIPFNNIHLLPVYISESHDAEADDKIYSYQKPSVDGEEMPIKYYKLLGTIDSKNNTELNIALIKEVFKGDNGEWVDNKEGVFRTKFSLTRSDCDFLGIDYQEGIEVIPKEELSNLTLIEKNTFNFDELDLSKYHKNKDGFIDRIIVGIDIKSDMWGDTIYNHYFKKKIIHKCLVPTFFDNTPIDYLILSSDENLKINGRIELLLIFDKPLNPETVKNKRITDLIYFWYYHDLSFILKERHRDKILKSYIDYNKLITRYYEIYQRGPSDIEGRWERISFN